jgi:hypothetical protein
LRAEKDGEMPDVTCLGCGERFEQITGRGRPRKYCRACGDRTPAAHRRWRKNRPKPAPPPKFTGRIGGGAKPGAGAPASPSS